MKAVVAIDSFKGHLTSMEAADAAIEAIGALLGPLDADIIPVSDGGEGFSSIVTDRIGGETVAARVHDPLGREMTASYGLKGNVAVIECAAASGLTLLAPDELDPMVATSYGTGELLADAIRRGATQVYVGLGGSATVDGGRGLLEALADAGGRTSAGWLADAAKFASNARIAAICDVEATFCGSEGAAAVYGPQKGATQEQIPELDARLEILAGQYFSILGRDVLTRKSTGAAGGMAGAIWAVLGGDIRPGADVILDIMHFEEHIKDADIVITGEGHLDAQTFQGKLPYVVAKRAKAFNPALKVVAYVGMSDYQQPRPPFDAIICRG